MRTLLLTLALIFFRSLAFAQVTDSTTDTITWVMGTTLDTVVGPTKAVDMIVEIDSVGRLEIPNCVQWPVVPDATPQVHCWITVPKLTDVPHTFAVTLDDHSGILRRFQVLNANPGKSGVGAEMISLTRTRTITIPTQETK